MLRLTGHRCVLHLSISLGDFGERQHSPDRHRRIHIDVEECFPACREATAFSERSIYSAQRMTGCRRCGNRRRTMDCRGRVAPGDQLGQVSKPATRPSGPPSRIVSSLRASNSSSSGLIGIGDDPGLGSQCEAAQSPLGGIVCEAEPAVVDQAG